MMFMVYVSTLPLPDFASLRFVSLIARITSTNLFRISLSRSSRISRIKTNRYYVLHLGSSSGEPYELDTPRGDECYAKEMP